VVGFRGVVIGCGDDCCLCFCYCERGFVRSEACLDKGGGGLGSK
jgi:hypothetical protein